MASLSFILHFQTDKARCTKNKPDKPKASKGPAESDVSPTEEVEVGTMDESTGAQAAGVIAQKIDLLLNSVQTKVNEQLQQQELHLRKQEKRVSLNELDKQSKSKTSKLPGDVLRPAQLPSFEDLKSDSRIQAEVERRLQDYQQTSRTETAGKPVQSLKSGRYRAGFAKICKHINWPQDFCSVASGSKQPTYDELTNEQWMQGFLFCVLDEEEHKIRENMLQYLTFLMQDAIELSMNTARKVHAAVLQNMERGNVSWEQLDLVKKEVEILKDWSRVIEVMLPRKTESNLAFISTKVVVSLKVIMFSITPSINTFVHIAFEKWVGSLNIPCKSV